jgi:NADH-quinone oxidoreductase subunit G
MAENGKVTVTIDGKEVTSYRGRLLIDVAEELDIFVPRFCYHPGMEPVAACRMCLVEIEGSKRPLEPACTTRIDDGMVVHTDSKIAVDAQESVLEMLLINHPLDCPICDRGGECPLQDQTLRFGPGRSRYVEEKRHFPKPIPISDLVLLDRERCVLCWRCVRFSEEIAGDPFIDLMDRGSLTQINIAGERPFDSYFSGNTIQICPVGALTSASYRFLSRPWDLAASPSVCSYCSVGCPISVEQRGGEVLRAQALPNENVNSFWICDKGRYGHRYPSHPDRLRAPLVRRESEGTAEFIEVSWEEALDEVTGRLRATLEEGGPSAAGLIGGSHCTNEDLYAASRFFREVVGTDNLDFRVFDAGFEYPVLSGGGIVGSSATLDDLDSAKTILWFGGDPREELPVLYLRLRGAVEKGARMVVVGPRRISTCELGDAVHLTHRPGDARAVMEALATGQGDSSADAGLIAETRELLDQGDVVVCAGPQFVGAPDPSALGAVRQVIEAFDGVRLLLCPPNANSQGALDMGIWPRGNGKDTRGMLRAAARGDLSFLWIVGADLVSDFPDRAVAEAALASGCFVVVSELFPTDTARSADVILPAASFAEKEGSFTNLERRLQKVNPAAPAPGAARSDWHIFRDAAAHLGVEFGWSSPAELAAEIAERMPSHEGFSYERLGVSPPPLPQSVRRASGSWPLTWELRAVDATRRRGWIWQWRPDAPRGPEGSRWRPDAPRGPEGSERASYANIPDHPPRDHPLALLVGRSLYDEGGMVTRSPELHNVTPGGFVELHPAEAEARGLQEDAEVVVGSARGRQRARLRISSNTPRGAAFVPFRQPGFRANLLIDSSEEATFVEVTA